MKLIIPKAGEPACQPDPYIIEHEGRFYIYATNAAGVTVYSADSLLGEWKYEGFALTSEGEKEFWAPCVYVEGGTFYMYYSTVREGETRENQNRLKVAVSDNPVSGFRFVKDLAEPFSIDPHVVRTPDGLFMFYSVNDETCERAGTYIVVDRMTDPLTLAGKPVSVLRPSLDEEIFMRDRFKKGQHWHTLEGAFYFKEGDTHYLMYSGNCYENPTYYVGYATAKGGDDLTKLRFHKVPDEHTYAPLLAKNETEEGTGHNSVIKSGGRYYIVYHGRDVAEGRPSYDTRTARILPMTVSGGKITLDRAK